MSSHAIRSHLLRLALAVGIISAAYLLGRRTCSSETTDVYMAGGLVVAVFADHFWHALRSGKGRVAALLQATGVALALGLFLAVFLPSFMGAGDRGRQKQTMANMRAVATSLEAYFVDHGGRPPQVEGNLVADYREYFEPTYIRALPVLNGWGFTMELHTKVAPSELESGLPVATQYRVISAGACGGFSQADRWAIPSGTTGKYVEDIVFSNRQFIRYPEGVQE